MLPPALFVPLDTPLPQTLKTNPMTNQNNEEMQSEAFNAMLEIAKKASLEILVVTDSDVEMYLEGDTELLAKLTPDILRKIKRDLIDELHESFCHAMTNAVANNIND